MERFSEHVVAFAYVEYSDGSGGKKRPVVVIRIDGEVISVYRVTSQFFNKSEYYQKRYYKIKDVLQAGLDRESWIDVSTSPLTYSLNEASFRIQGRLSRRDIEGLKQFIRDLEKLD